MYLILGKIQFEICLCIATCYFCDIIVNYLIQLLNSIVQLLTVVININCIKNKIIWIKNKLEIARSQKIFLTQILIKIYRKANSE